MIPCCQRSSDAEPTAKALFRLHRSEKHHTVRVRSKMRKFRDVLTQDGGTVVLGLSVVRRQRYPGRITGTSLGRTDVNGKRASQKCTTSEHWQPGVFSSPTSAQEREKVSVEADGSQEEVRLKVFHPKGECDVGCSEHKGVSSRRVSERRNKLGKVQPEKARCVDQTAGTRSAENLRFLAEAEMRAVDPDEHLDMDGSDADDFEVIPGRNAALFAGHRVHLESSSAKRACAISPPVSRDANQTLGWGQYRCPCLKMQWRWT